MYDYFLGGAHNVGVERDLARQVLAISPGTPMVAQSNRAFLHRAVGYLSGQRIRQFIDVGSGIPTQGNVHETAQQVHPESRVLYVDHDPVAVAHSELQRVKDLYRSAADPITLRSRTGIEELFSRPAPSSAVSRANPEVSQPVGDDERALVC